jgi:endonuclease YncB( thermonuclease family)
MVQIEKPDTPPEERGPPGFFAPVVFAKMAKSGFLMEHGEGLHRTWVELAYQEPPQDLLGRILWSAGVLGQLVISLFTFSAALACFLLEEAVQSYGMGAYMLSTADAYEELDQYLNGYDAFIDGAETGALSLATLSPMTGGAVVLYMEAAKQGAAAFRHVAQKGLLEKAAYDKKTRHALMLKNKYGELRLSSRPSNAEIWLNGENLEVLTPETLEYLPAGTHEIELRYYDSTNEQWSIKAETITIEAGSRKELMIQIPPKITSNEEEEENMKQHGEIRLKSTPTDARIFLDGKDTELLTPETFDKLEPGKHVFKLIRYMPQTEETIQMTKTITIETGERKEIIFNLHDMTETSTDVEEDVEHDEEMMPAFLTVEATGDVAKDGDTFKATNDEWVRLIGIDTPEAGRPFYEEAKKELQEQIEDKELTLKIQTSRPFDIYERTLAEVRNYKGNVNVAMLSKGLARQNWFEEDTFDRTRYQAAEDLAKQRGLGIWKEKYG